MARAAASPVDQQLLTFRVAGEHFALPASDVSEVIRPPAVTRVPLSPLGLSGVANLRGAVLPIVSLRTVLGTGTGDTPSSQRVIVVNRGTLMGLAVDEVTALTTSVKANVVADGSKAGKRAKQDHTRLLDLDSVLAQTFDAVSRRARSAPLSGEAPRSQPVTAARHELSLVCFAVGQQDYALPLDRVSEVVALPAEVATIPRSDNAMLGVTTIRGRLLPLVSLAALLGQPSRASADTRARIVVVQVGGAALGLVIDRMKEILRVPETSIDPVPAILTRGAGETEIQGICRLDNGRRLVSILSTDRLLRDVERSGYLSGENPSGENIVATNADGEATEQFVVFQLGGEDFGLPISAVDEIVRVPETLTRLPSAPAFVEGVMNLRGRVVPVIDQRQRFEVEPSRSGRRERVIVVTIDRMQAGFVVDGVSEVLRVSLGQLRPAPELAADRSRVIDRIANIEVEGRMILLLDARELLDRAERDLLAATRVAEPSRRTT